MLYKKIVYLLSISLILILSGYICLSFIYTPNKLNESQVLIIEPQAKTIDIAHKLAHHNIVSSSALFAITAKLYSLKYTLKSGEYLFPANISPIKALRILASGKSIIHKIVVPEGAVVAEIVQKLNNEKRLFGKINSIVTEGSLAPSTYFFIYGDKRQELINQMTSLMNERINRVKQKLSTDSPLKSAQEILILASIVEKETSVESELPLIAAVFLNRIRAGMKLQSDPTVIYALTHGKSKLDRLLTRKDLAVRSEYNTYYVSSLPPFPISCPGEKTLEAVAQAPKSNVLYFVANNKGSHIFADSYDKHLKNVRLYRKKS